MDEILKTLAEHTGIGPETARNALGAVMAFLKAHLPGDLAGKLGEAIPHADGLAASYEQNKAPAPGGLIGAVEGLAGKVLGGEAGEVAELASMLGRAGLGIRQAEAFLPRAFDLLKGQIPPALLAEVKGLIPGLGRPPAKS